MPRKEEEKDFEVVIKVSASEISDMAYHLLDVLHDDLVDDGYPQAADLKIFILEKAINVLKELFPIMG